MCARERSRVQPKILDTSVGWTEDTENRAAFKGLASDGHVSENRSVGGPIPPLGITTGATPLSSRACASVSSHCKIVARKWDFSVALCSPTKRAKALAASRLCSAPLV